jgi:hypothetical protein
MEYAFTFHPRRDLVLRYAKGSTPAPVAPTAKGQSKSQEQTHRWIKFGGNGTSNRRD